MKKIRVGFVGGFWVAALVFGFVQTAFSKPLKSTSLRYEAGMELSYDRYQETVYDVMTQSNVFFMRDTALYLGLAGSVAYYNDVFLKFDGVAKAGYVNYESNGTGSSSGVIDTITDIRGLIGWNFYEREWRVTPFIGLGYRYLYDRSYHGGKPSSTGHVGYDREANYLYTPLGFEVLTSLNRTWDIGAAFEIDYFWRGFQESHLEQPGITLMPLINKQNDGIGFRASVRAIRCVPNQSYRWVVEPYVRYWDIEQSTLNAAIKPDNGLYLGTEPDNYTVEAGVKVALLF